MNNNSNENEAPNAPTLNQAKAATKPSWFSGIRTPTLAQFNSYRASIPQAYMPSLFGGRSERRSRKNRSERSSRKNRSERSSRKNRSERSNRNRSSRSRKNRK